MATTVYAFSLLISKKSSGLDKLPDKSNFWKKGFVCLSASSFGSTRHYSEQVKGAGVRANWLVGNTARKQRRMPMLIGILDVLEGRVIQVFSRFGDREWGKEREVNLILVLTWASGKWSKFEKKCIQGLLSWSDLQYGELWAGVWSLSENTLELRMHWFNEFMNPIKDICNPQNMRGSIQTILSTEIPNSSNTMVFTLSS